jgi:hypothetical protein
MKDAEITLLNLAVSSMVQMWRSYSAKIGEYNIARDYLVLLDLTSTNIKYHQLHSKYTYFENYSK